MATHEFDGAAPTAQFEVSVHWSDQQPAVVARLDRAQARDLVKRLAQSAPGEVEPADLGPKASSVSLLMGIQAFYRLIFQSDSTLSLADVDGGLWAIPARSVRSVRVRLVSASPAGVEPDVIPMRRARVRDQGAGASL
jgi:hypothetical protein